jgi:hypothetical protein
VIASGRLEQLWEQVEARWKGQPSMQWYDPDTRSSYTVELDRPYWDEVTLQIAEAVRTHQPVARLTFPSYLAGQFHRPSDMTDWLADLRGRFSVVAQELADAGLAAEGRADTEKRAKQHQRRARSLLRTMSPQRLHAAFGAYRKWVESSYVELDGKQSSTGGTKVRLIDFIRNHTDDIPLTDLDTHRIDAILDTIGRRPVSKRTGKPIARKSATNTIKEIRQFVRWLHRSPEWDWTRPLDYEVRPVRVITTPEERGGRVHQVKTYTVGELRLLWQYANPTERLMIALGLNCGFGRAEVATLELDEVRLHTPNPVLRVGDQKSPTEADESWIMRGRHKTGVFGIWRLWPLTVRAVEWWLSMRPKTDITNLLVTRKGESFAKRTSGGRQNGRVTNIWKALTDRVRKDHPEFSVLSFGKLRKTGATLVRLHGGGEAASLYLAHGVAYQGDDLLEVYSNRPFSTLFSTLAVVNEQLALVWEGVADPFPAALPMGGPNLQGGLFGASWNCMTPR